MAPIASDPIDRHHRSPAPDRRDRALAARTIPRGERRGDGDERPAVDEEAWLLHARYQRTRDPATLDLLVAHYRNLAHALARRLHRSGEPLEDLDQVALEALVRALQRFDCQAGTPFAAYATPTILGALKRHYRDHGWTLRVPRATHDLVGPARRTADRLAGEQGRPPRVEEVADAMGVDAGTLGTAMAAARARTTVSIDAPARADGEGPVAEPGAVDGGYVRAEDRNALTEALRDLSARDRTVLGLYFFEELTQTQISDRFGVSQMQVSRWISSALRRLRARMSTTEAPAGPAPCPG